MSYRKFIDKFYIPSLKPIVVASDATLCLIIFLEIDLSSTTVVSRLMFKKVENV